MKGPKPKTNEERFWGKVQVVDECWEWEGARIFYYHKNGTKYGGYGTFGVREEGITGHKMMLTHRFSWVLHFGDIPEGVRVLHRCDNPPCVRPDHLFLGSAADNGKDMARKGRSGLAKLTLAEVRELRAMTGTQKRIAMAFGISPSAVSAIQRGKTWNYPKAYPTDD